MILSMTGFGKAQREFESKTITVEVKSLNSRNADIKLRLPNHYREKELVIRNTLVKALDRGKIDFSLSVHDQEGTVHATINKARFLAYFSELKGLAEQTHTTQDDLFGLALKMPEVIESNEEELNEKEWEQALEVIHVALKNLSEFRAREGRELEDDFNDRNQAILTALEKVEQLAPERAQSVETRLQGKLEELKTLDGADRQRMQQEIVYYLEKYDINEEIVRLKSHCSHFSDTVKEPNSQGKKLGFISQEMGREINTIGSKANHAEIQQLVVSMKDELEKIKEQVLNIL